MEGLASGFSSGLGQSAGTSAAGSAAGQAAASQAATSTAGQVGSAAGSAVGQSANQGVGGALMRLIGNGSTEPAAGTTLAGSVGQSTAGGSSGGYAPVSNDKNNPNPSSRQPEVGSAAYHPQKHSTPLAFLLLNQMPTADFYA